MGPAELRRDDGLYVQRRLRRQDLDPANARSGTVEAVAMKMRPMLVLAGCAVLSIRAQPLSTTLATGQQPMAIAVNEITNRAYVAGHNSSSVTVIDGKSRQ